MKNDIANNYDNIKIMVDALNNVNVNKEDYYSLISHIEKLATGSIHCINDGMTYEFKEYADMLTESEIRRINTMSILLIGRLSQEIGTVNKLFKNKLDKPCMLW